MLLVGCLFIGVSEELMFRGIGVTAFRQAGFTEGKVALWTCVLFGLAHATNIFSEGLGALPQVLVTAVAGYFFYVTRRVSGLLIVSMIIHGLWDFGLFTTTLSTPTSIGGVAVHPGRHRAGHRGDRDDPEGLSPTPTAPHDHQNSYGIAPDDCSPPMPCRSPTSHGPAS